MIASVNVKETNPRKGTETALTSTHDTLSTVKETNPRKGTETQADFNPLRKSC